MIQGCTRSYRQNGIPPSKGSYLLHQIAKDAIHTQDKRSSMPNITSCCSTHSVDLYNLVSSVYLPSGRYTIWRGPLLCPKQPEPANQNNVYFNLSNQMEDIDMK